MYILILQSNLDTHQVVATPFAGEAVGVVDVDTAAGIAFLQRYHAGCTHGRTSEEGIAVHHDSGQHLSLSVLTIFSTLFLG